MLAIGLHFGYFSIRIGLCFRNRSTGIPQFKPVTRSSYGIDEWWSIFQGALPNCYDPESNLIGYEALINCGLENCKRFDGHYFNDLLQSQTDATNLWEKFVRLLRVEYIHENEPIRLGIYFEDIQLSPKLNPKMPWLIGPNRTNELSEKLFELSKSYQISKTQIFDERKAIEHYVASNDLIKRGDILALFEGERTSCWLVEEQTSGQLFPLTSAPGLRDLMVAVHQDNELHLTDYVSCLHRQDCLEYWPKLDELNSWIAQSLKPALVLAWQAIPDPDLRELNRRLLVGGEGAYLIHTAKRDNQDIRSVLENPWYIQAFSAAAIAMEEYQNNVIKEK